jgi:hypothetical protein
MMDLAERDPLKAKLADRVHELVRSLAVDGFDVQVLRADNLCTQVKVRGAQGPPRWFTVKLSENY